MTINTFENKLKQYGKIEIINKYKIEKKLQIEKYLFILNNELVTSYENEKKCFTTNIYHMYFIYRKFLKSIDKRSKRTKLSKEFIFFGNKNEK